MELIFQRVYIAYIFCQVETDSSKRAADTHQSLPEPACKKSKKCAEPESSTAVDLGEWLRKRAKRQQAQAAEEKSQAKADLAAKRKEAKEARELQKELERAKKESEQEAAKLERQIAKLANPKATAKAPNAAKIKATPKKKQQ